MSEINIAPNNLKINQSEIFYVDLIADNDNFFKKAVEKSLSEGNERKALDATRRVVSVSTKDCLLFKIIHRASDFSIIEEAVDLLSMGNRNSGYEYITNKKRSQKKLSETFETAKKLHGNKVEEIFLFFKGLYHNKYKNQDSNTLKNKSWKLGELIITSSLAISIGVISGSIVRHQLLSQKTFLHLFVNF